MVMAEYLNTKFATTNWTVVEGAHGGGEKAYSSLVKLCEAYRYPVYAFIRNRCGDPEEARDLCQAFFAELIVEKRVFENAKRGEGKFRTYLLACVKNFLTGDYHRKQAQKRGAGVEHLAFDDLEGLYLGGFPEGEGQDLTYDRIWARVIFDRVWSEIEREHELAGDLEKFSFIRAHLMGESTETFAEVCESMGLSEGGLKTAVHRLRKKFRTTLRAKVAEVVEHPSEVDEEISYLIRVI